MAAGQADGSKIGSVNSSLPTGGRGGCGGGGVGRITDGLLLDGFGIGNDCSASPLSGGKYAPTGLFPCGTSLSRGGKYWLLTCGRFGITCGRWV